MTLLLLATGGTIASSVSAEGIRVRMSGQELLDAARQHAPLPTDVEVNDVADVASWNLAPTKVVSVLRNALDDLGRGVTGVVVTHGTDTVEESAFLAWLFAGESQPAPLVFTCAMRAADQPDADGWANLRDAFRVATLPEASALGPVLVANGQVHSGRFVTKTRATDIDTFRSPGWEPVARVVGRRVRFGEAPVAPNRAHATGLDDRVAFIKAYGALPPTVLDQFFDGGAPALVLEGSGAGNVPGHLTDAIGRWTADGRPVVVTTRSLEGPAAPIYGGPGGGATLEGLGAIVARDLPGLRAWWATAVAVGSGATTPDDVRAFLELTEV